MKNEIKITSDNSEVIDILLNNAQFGCSARLLTYKDLEKSAHIAESLLGKILKKQHRQNVCAYVRPEYSAFSASYRGTPEHTHCVIRRGAKCWYVSSIERAKAHRAGSYRVSIDLKSLESKRSEMIEFVTNNLASSTVIKNNLQK